MLSAVEKAKKFLNEEKAFRLGGLPTESSHPQTCNLSETIKIDSLAGIRLLQSVDEEIPPVAEKIFQKSEFQELLQAFIKALGSGKKIFFTGCGATGRLSILLEAAWRRFWRQLNREQPSISAKVSKLEDCIVSIMAGGDFALIKSVEGFEDFLDFGKYQLKQAGVGKNDVVVAITEGGETPFVIGTVWQGLQAKAKVFFIYNNPTEILRKNVQRSSEIIEEPRITKLDLTTGPMAITGSTRMQAVTIELLIVGSALEIALTQFLQSVLPACDWARHPRLKGGDALAPASRRGYPGQWPGLMDVRTTKFYHQLFVNLLKHLAEASSVNAMARATEFEENIYRHHGLITYLADSILLDVLTDTTERSPTFMVPPFRKHSDNCSPQSWAFVQNPFKPTPDAWREILQREPRGLEWGPSVYRQLNAPSALQATSPRLDNAEIYEFRIGNEPAISRADAPVSALVAIAIEDEAEHLLSAGLKRFGSLYKKNAAYIIGYLAPATGRGTPADRRGLTQSPDKIFQFQCDLSKSPLRLAEHLAVKLILNTISTATMSRMGRVIGNYMVWLSPSNKKLIDRGSRLISQVTGCSYEQACIALHQAMDEVESRSKKAEEVPSPVALAIKRIGTAQKKS